MIAMPLDMAAFILKQYDSLPIFNEFANVVTKLQTVLDGVVTNSIEARRQMIQFEESPNYKGLGFDSTSFARSRAAEFE